MADDDEEKRTANAGPPPRPANDQWQASIAKGLLGVVVIAAILLITLMAKK